MSIIHPAESGTELTRLNTNGYQLGRQAEDRTWTAGDSADGLPMAAEETQNEVLRTLPPVDGGYQAWSFLAACFALEAIVWSLPFSFGIFQKHYSLDPTFADQTATLASIGTTNIGVAYFLSPFLAVFLQRFPRIRWAAMPVGLAIMTFALVGASYCNTASGLVATQGALYGFGAILLYFPSNLFLDEWFVRRKSLAFGLMWAGTGASGAGTPFLLQWLLDSYGFRSALRIWAVVMVILTLPCLYYVRPRLPSSGASALRPRDLRFLKGRPFWLFQIGNILQSLGSFIPSLWMPTFALYLGLPTFAGPLSLAFYNGAYSVGTAAGGAMTDRLHATVVIMVSSTGAMLASFLFWGFASGQVMLYIFAILWGVFAGMFNGTWAGCAKVIGSKEPNGVIDTGILIGIMAAGKGIGGVVSGPLSEKLLALDWRAGSEFTYGSAYSALVVFCGVCGALGGSACLGRLTKTI